MKNKFLLHLTASDCYTALCLASISLSTDIIVLKSKPDWLYFSFLFFATFLFYNFQKISWFGHARMRHEDNLKYYWPANYPGLLLLSLIIGYLGTVALIGTVVNSPYKIGLGLVAALLALSYNQKIFGIRLRSLKGFKAFTIALVAIIAGLLMPAARIFDFPLSLLPCLIYALAQFLFICALCIAADIRDIDEDRADQIKTFPVSAGLSIAKKMIALLIIMQLSLLFFVFKLNFINSHQFESFVVVSLLSIFFVYPLQSKNSYFYFVLGIDGLIALQTICLFII